MKIAVEGCCHGSLDATYRQIAYLENKNNIKVDVLLIGGDFQAIRNHADLQCMSVPEKYRALGEFHKYYTGLATAPVLTVVIGGNHEASNYLWELYHGGWLAPNIYFLGVSGCVNVNGVKIAGASGIYKSNDFRLGHFEKLPYDRSALRSIYHVREYDVLKLLQLPSPDVFMSHDWPEGIVHHGDVQALLRKKPFFREDIDSHQLGSPPMMQILKKLRPKKWFAAHLHVRFEATFSHISSSNPAATAANPDEIAIDDDEDFDAVPEPEPELAPESAPEPLPVPAGNNETQFLALDKCLPKRQFLEVVDFPTNSLIASEPTLESMLPTSFGKQEPPPYIPPKLTFNIEWLAITRAMHPWLSTDRIPSNRLPTEETTRAAIDKEIEWVRKNIGEDMEIGDVQQFVMTAPGPEPNRGKGKPNQQPMWYTNPQTEAFCNLLQLENKINPVPKELMHAAVPEASASGEPLPAASEV